jgi:hypothetical protein
MSLGFLYLGFKMGKKRVQKSDEAPNNITEDIYIRKDYNTVDIKSLL